LRTAKKSNGIVKKVLTQRKKIKEDLFKMTESLCYEGKGTPEKKTVKLKKRGET